MKIKKAIAITMAFVACYFIGITGVFAVGETESKPPIAIFDATVTEIDEDFMYFNVNVFGDIHTFTITADSAPEFYIGENCLVAIEMHNEEIFDTWEIRGIR